MTIAWYGHLKYKESPLLKVILISWGIAFVVFCIFSFIYLKEELKWNYLVGFSMMIGAVFFIFKEW